MSLPKSKQMRILAIFAGFVAIVALGRIVLTLWNIRRWEEVS